jgi:hypothetical protein
MDLDVYHHFTRRLQAHLEGDPRVLGLVALGSMAEIARLPDAWSDHDFFVITTPGSQEMFRSDLSWLPDGDQIALRIRETAHGLKVLYGSGHLLEFAVFDETELAAVHANDYRVLMDRAAITSIMAQIASPTPPDAGYDAARDLAMVLALIYVGAGRYARGEHLSAHAFVKLYVLHHLLPLLAHLLDSEHKTRLDTLDPFRRFEQVFPQAGADINRALLMPPLEAAQALLTLAERIAQPALPDYPAQAALTVRQYLQRIAQNESR